MIANYLTVAWRNLAKQKVYTGINICGLAIAIACGLLVFLFLWHECTYDAFHEKADRIFRVYLEDTGKGDIWGATDAQLPQEVGPILAEDYAGIARSVRLARGNWPIERGDEAFYQEFLFADPEIVQVFSFTWKRGERAKALDAEYSTVLTEATAKRYFGEDDPLGKTLAINFTRFVEAESGNRTEVYNFTVSGIVEVPEKSTIQFDLLLPFAMARRATTAWTHTYVLLQDGVEADDIEEQFPSFVQHQLQKDPAVFALHLQPLRDIYMDPPMIEGIARGNPKHSYILAGIGLLVLIVACINFTNLAIAQGATRTKEIGVRKVLGADRSQLMGQFWGEAVLLSALALGLGIVLAELALPAFNNLVQRPLHLGYAELPVLLAALALILSVGLVAGGYPAVVLSSFRPVAILRDAPKLGRNNAFSRGLVVLQFALSGFLIVCTLVMEHQLNYMKSKDLGFDGEQVVFFQLPDGKGDLLGVFRNELEPHGEVQSVSGMFPGVGWGYMSTHFERQDAQIQTFLFYADYNCLKTLGLQLVAGRNFDRRFSTDATEAVIVNQTLADLLEGDPLGQVLDNFSAQDVKNPRVVGVVEDFHLSSLHEEIPPTVLILEAQVYWGDALVRLDAGDISAGVALLRETWSRIAPGQEFDYHFLDDRFETRYREEERWSRIVGYTAGLAILIACLGMFGLAALAVSRRTKEIGIRKVLGATVAGIVALLARDFVKLVALANVVAWPLAYYAMGRWLRDFAYRIDLGPGLFVLGGVLALVLVLAAVALQALRAARINPVEALRYE